MAQGGHAEEILAKLDQERCLYCGDRPVRGARVCLGCAMRMSTGELIAQVARMNEPPDAPAADRAS
jgi:hypothetical protein